MANEFSAKDVAALLVKCHRRCCICHRFCGVKIEIDHITPKADGGSGDISNAIAVCFECHAEIHSYNNQHPRGRKFRPEELRLHKEQWMNICEKRPEVFREVGRESDVGPLQALIDELDFNLHVSQYSDESNVGCLFVDEQFRRAIREGSISMLQQGLKDSILEAYRAMNRANQLIPKPFQHIPGMITYSPLMSRATASIVQATTSIENARNSLLQFLSSEDTDG